MKPLKELNPFSGTLATEENKTPLIFVGHGSPMNGIEDNEFSNGWRLVEEDIARPNAVLCISAHWETRGTFLTAMESPKTIHDFYGFPDELYTVEYPATGDPLLAETTKRIIKKTDAGLARQQMGARSRHMDRVKAYVSKS